MNYLQLTSSDSNLLIILTILLSVFFLIGIIVAILVIRVLASINRVVAKAESVIVSVESAADVLKDVGGHLSIIKLVKNIIDLIQRKKKE